MSISQPSFLLTPHLPAGHPGICAFQSLLSSHRCVIGRQSSLQSCSTGRDDQSPNLAAMLSSGLVPICRYSSGFSSNSRIQSLRYPRSLIAVSWVLDELWWMSELV